MASNHPPENGVGGDDEREEDDDAEEEEDEEVREDEEEEPRLKYQRLGGSVPSLLSNDAAASISVAERMIALGTHDGTVHILDFQGNQTSYYISGIAPFGDTLVVLAYIPEENAEKDFRSTVPSRQKKREKKKRSGLSRGREKEEEENLDFFPRRVIR
ncbi:hypothetical protein BHE74_00040560, partial [Ensete ventricosum]